MADDSWAPMNGAVPNGEEAPPASEVNSHESEERAAKRLKMDNSAESLDLATDVSPSNDAPAEVQTAQPGGESTETKTAKGHVDGRVRGLAPVKKEYLLDVSSQANPAPSDAVDDDAAEGRGQEPQRRDNRDSGMKKKDKGQKGQNSERSFGTFSDAIRLCNSRVFYPEFSPGICRFGERCKLCHDLRKYLAEGRRGDVETFEGKCPVFEAYGRCSSGWKCRFVNSHMKEIEHEDGRKELVLIEDTTKVASRDAAKENADESRTEKENVDSEDVRPGIYNLVPMSLKIDLNRKRTDFAKADRYIHWLEKDAKANLDINNYRKNAAKEDIETMRAQFVEPPFKPSEKRRIYFGRETPVLAPLTTQGNLPFRRLCVDLGAQITYSEMAMGAPLVQGAKADWTLMKVHESELAPPRFTPGANPVFDRGGGAAYDNAGDIRFGAQIAASANWVATKAADVLSRYCPHLRVLDLNCGCPIDMIFKSGGGSALLDNHSKMERLLRGMNAVSGEIPVTAKIRMGVRNARPTAAQLIGRLAFGAREHRARLGAPGCAALTLHGRSREQRYTKQADWAYIGECAALVRSYNEQRDRLADTAAEPDESTLANTRDGGRMFFLGNGDCFSHVEYHEHIDRARVDSVMVGRGALVKPWLFEEIEKGQYLDKTAGERLRYVESFVRYGLEAWGSDELGIGFTRRFLLEWLSFTHRYVPIGLLEYLPPSLNDRPPAYQGRNDLETLLASENYKDWIKITEMFLGPAHPGFKFQPKHKSNAYEAEG